MASSIFSYARSVRRVFGSMKSITLAALRDAGFPVRLAILAVISFSLSKVGIHRTAPDSAVGCF